MSFCLPHRVSLVLAVEGIPVHWESLNVPKPSGSCPLCRANREGKDSFHKALKKWVEAGRMDSRILSDDPKVYKKYSDINNSAINYEEQQQVKQRIREENNNKIVATLNKSKSKALSIKKPNHLRLV